MTIIYTKKAQKNIEKLDKSLKSKLKIAIEKLPFGDIKRLQGQGENILFRLRVGNLRVLFEMDFEIIKIRAVLPRGEVYKNI